MATFSACHMIISVKKISKSKLKIYLRVKCAMKKFALTSHIVQIQRLGYEKKLQEKSETAMTSPLQRASKRAPATRMI